MVIFRQLNRIPIHYVMGVTSPSPSSLVELSHPLPLLSTLSITCEITKKYQSNSDIVLFSF